jgi:hypothetical protein
MKPKKTKPQQDLLINETDGPWKDVLEHFFQPFLEFCFPEWAKQIDWKKGYKTLKADLPAREGTQICDMIFEVTLLTGKKSLLLLHLEIQGQKQKDFASRMMGYNASIYKRKKRQVISAAILIDDDPSWRPDCFEQQHPFTGKLYHQFFFDTVKLLDYRGKEEELKKEKNIFALVFLAQLAVMESRKNQDLRKERKTALARELFTRGLKKDTISKLYKFIDWLIKLDPEHMKTFEKEIVKVAGRESWQDWDPVYVSTFEQVGMMRGMEKGMEKGLKQGLVKGLEQGLEQGPEQGLEQGLVKGLEQGLEQGRLESLRNTLDRMLRRRFPTKVTAKHLHRIDQADADSLAQWAENLVVADAIEEVFSGK